MYRTQKPCAAGHPEHMYRVVYVSHTHNRKSINIGVYNIMLHNSRRQTLPSTSSNLYPFVVRTEQTTSTRLLRRPHRSPLLLRHIRQIHPDCISTKQILAWSPASEVNLAHIHPHISVDIHFGQPALRRDNDKTELNGAANSYWCAFMIDSKQNDRRPVKRVCRSGFSNMFIPIYIACTDAPNTKEFVSPSNFHQQPTLSYKNTKTSSSGDWLCSTFQRRLSGLEMSHE